MELITILIMSVIIIVILAVLVKFNLKNIKLIKQIGEDKNLNEITNNLPENEEICKQILKMLNNETVNIKVGSDNSQSSLYIVATNSIYIANIKNTFTRVQTIAHECIHSIQDKQLLWFNFIFSNIYLIYFVITTILSAFNKLPNKNVFAIILIMMSMLLYIIRSYIETDAMIKAKFLAKQYMEENQEAIDKDKIKIIIENYDRLNSIGIKYYNYKLIFDYLCKIIIFCVVSIIETFGDGLILFQF